MDSDRELLFGLLALQNGLIDQSRLVSAFQAWALDKRRSLADYLVDRGDLDADDRAALAVMVERHLRKHGDAERSLATLSMRSTSRQVLMDLKDPDLTASLGHVSRWLDAMAESTVTYSVGSEATDGQRFRVLRPHARGGLGAVFVALDGELNREVALKQILDQHADNPVSRDRFVIEAEVTGGLEHPGIVPVYGLGTYANGRPFYAMRFIRGDSLKQAIAAFHQRAGMKRVASRHSLELHKLLRRFLDVCNAMEYAHARGVLHRDIKPGNIIVGRYGETLVVDWGLAKATGKADPVSDERTLQPSSGSSGAETLPGRALGTPGYMSPEQARGDLDALGPRSDVYSLGATLYCLLTGRPPYAGEDRAELIERTQRGEFPPPRKLDPSIDASLEAICLKAMATAPKARYGSCRALGEEIERWLSDEPVAARREPLRERASRWLRKHPVLASAAAAALLVGLSAALWNLRRERIYTTNLKSANAALDTQRKRAEARERLAIDAVKRFRDAVVENADLKNDPALDSLRKTLLKEPLEFFRLLRERLEADHDTRPESLDLLASAALDLGDLTSEIGGKEDAVRIFEEARAICERLVREHPADNHLQHELARVHHNLGIVLGETGRPNEALASHERARAIFERLARSQPAAPRLSQEIAKTDTGMGLILRLIGKPAEALASYERARVILEPLVREHPAASECQSILAASYEGIAMLLREMGKPDEALASYRRGVEILDRLVREHPGDPTHRFSLARTYSNMGITLAGREQWTEALASYERALAILEPLVREHPSVTAYQSDLSWSHANISNVLKARGQGAEALASQERALAIRERLAREHPSVTDFHEDLALSHDGIGDLLFLSGKSAEARTSYAKALVIRERLVREHPESHWYANSLGGTLHDLAVIDLKAGRVAAARDQMREAVTWKKKALAAFPRHPQYRESLTRCLSNLIHVAQDLGDDALAAEAHRELEELERSDPRIQALDARLAEVRQGAAPRDNAERLDLAVRAYDTRYFSTAARLWAEALATDPVLAGDRSLQHPYNAACAASLAASGKGRDEPAPDDGAKARLRGQALEWLRGELAAWESQIEKGPVEARDAVVQTLRYWQKDGDLAVVRDKEALAALPEPERENWHALWDQVRTLLQRAEADPDASTPSPEANSPTGSGAGEP